MKTPFAFGKVVLDKDFTDRVWETERLVQNFESLANTILISPRRWGKSSLVKKAAHMASEKNAEIRFCFIDMNNIRSEEGFYQSLATEVLKVSSGKLQVVIKSAKRLLSGLIPSITIGTEPESSFRLTFDWNEVKKDPSGILNLAEKLALGSKCKYIICIDEFQNVAEFENPQAFQKTLRAHWQKHQNTAYCLYGSKQHLLMDVFTSPSMPFYKFGDIVFLDKISKEEWITFISGRFSDTGKTIVADDAALIAQLTECHSYYVQQLAQQSWLRTHDTCSNEIIVESFEGLVLQLSMLFQTLTDSLSKNQLSLLRAVINNVKQLSSTATINEYQMGTSANILKIKKALVSREIIDIRNDNVEFLDPLYKYWLKNYFFKI